MTKQEINEAINSISCNELMDIQSEAIKIYAISEILKNYFFYCVEGSEKLGNVKSTIISGALDAVFEISENLVYSKLDDLTDKISDLKIE